MAKWLKSVNASNEESRRLGKLTAKALGFSEKTYRKSLAVLRKYIGVTEVKMSAGAFDQIEYATIPSKAMSNYRKAFLKNDGERFQNYLESVKNGKAKINTGTLYPYDIVMKYINGPWMREYDETLELMWKNLPNYIEGKNNVLVMADTSGSMKCGNGRPFASSVGLAIYFAERNYGEFKNKFMTFDTKPHFVTLKDGSLKEKLESIAKINGNTNLMAAMDMILNVAVANDIKKEDMPKALVVISDMEFDEAVTLHKWENSSSLSYTSGFDSTYNESYNALIKRKFINAGYDIPKIVFWNVESRNNVFHACEKDGMDNVILVSGNSASTFKNLLANISGNAEDVMWNVLNNNRYDIIVDYKEESEGENKGESKGEM